MSPLQPPPPLNPLSTKPRACGGQMLPISRYEPMLRRKNADQPAFRHHTHHIQEPLSIELTVTLVPLQKPLSTKRLNTLLKIIRPMATGIHMPVILSKALVAHDDYSFRRNPGRPAPYLNIRHETPVVPTISDKN